MIPVDDVLGNIREEQVTAYMKILSQYLTGGSKGNLAALELVFRSSRPESLPRKVPIRRESVIITFLLNSRP
jgi:hypothetical protein